MLCYRCYTSFFFFNDTATTEIYTLSLHDALPICPVGVLFEFAFRTPHAVVEEVVGVEIIVAQVPVKRANNFFNRSEEHTSELQSLTNLVCRLLLEKKKEIDTVYTQPTTMTSDESY